MEWMVNNWYLIIGSLAILVFGGYKVAKFYNLPTPKQIQAIKEWLVYACIEAEKALGGKTGQLKLRMVYDMFIKKFPWFVKVISFETFSSWVDIALIEVKRILENNKNIAVYVNNEK